jgi:hypothetical protein
MRETMSVAALLLLAACARATPTPTPDPAASAAGTPARASASVSAPAPALSASAAPIDPRCRGATIDLTAIVLQGLCGAPASVAPPAGALRVSVAAPSQLASGTEAPMTLTFTNASSDEASFTLSQSGGRNAFASLDLGPGWGAAAKRDAAPKEELARLPMLVATRDGAKTFNPRGSLLTALSARSLVHLAPGGTAILKVTLAARGFLPTTPEITDTSQRSSPPDPLPPGAYTITPQIPIEGVADPTIALTVTRR